LSMAVAGRLCGRMPHDHLDDYRHTDFGGHDEMPPLIPGPSLGISAMTR
jgi:hypothetical protein